MSLMFQTARWGTEVAPSQAWTSRRVALICFVINELFLTPNRINFIVIKYVCPATLAC